MSNPYAPPEDRPRSPEGAPTGTGSGAPADGSPADGSRDGGSAPAGAPHDGERGAAPATGRPVPPHPPGAWPGGGRPSPWSRPGPEGGSSDERPDRAGPGPAAEAIVRVQRLAGTFLVLVLASLLVATRPLPWRVATTVFAVLAIVWGVRALTVAVRAGFRGALPAMLGIGVAIAAGWALLTVSSLVEWDAMRTNEQCVAQALTVRANHECAQQFQRDVQQQRNRLPQQP